jgi:hypothetical protein
MSNSTIDLADPRTQRAITIAADAGQWARCTTRGGQHLFGIPSSKAGSALRYLTDAESCTCPDQIYNPWRDCKHITAVRIHELLANPAPGPAPVTTGGRMPRAERED